MEDYTTEDAAASAASGGTGNVEISGNIDNILQHYLLPQKQFVMTAGGGNLLLKQSK